MMLVSQDGKDVINLDNVLRMVIVTFRERLVSDDDYVRTRPEFREKITSKIRCFTPLLECVDIATFTSENKAVEALKRILDSIECESDVHYIV